jgi:2',3'-cyclic-nucleotide 2'-phosphodiesterase (5'-nucleotidase family)
MKTLTCLSFAVAFTLLSCGGIAPTVSVQPAGPGVYVDVGDSNAVALTFLQLNDVYEIAPVENGMFGGMARVATVQRDLRKENPNTITVLAGDFISPSAIGTSVHQGKRINGAQMVDAMNAVGVDFVTFGNHEFDLGYEALQSRINQSHFTWISSNIQYTPSEEGYVGPFEKHVNGSAEPFPESYILRVQNAAGRELRIGIIGLTLGSNRPPYIVWSDPLESAQRVCKDLRNKTDLIVAITHLSIDDDKKLAALVPDVKLILGGHEHTNMMFKVGETIISKADANARTVFIHRLRWSTTTKSLTIQSEIKTIDNLIAEEPGTARVVNEWTDRAYEGFRQKGFDPDQVVAIVAEPLDGRESSIRHRQTNLGTAVAHSMLAAAKSARIAIFNSGSIRLDDQLSGTITQYDIIRTLPFGGKILEVEMKGSLLQQALDAGRKNSGRGGYLQYAGVGFDSSQNTWSVAGKRINVKARYNVIVSDYLFSGNEQGLEFFSRQHPDVVSVIEPDPADAADLRRDIRLAVIAFLQKK